MSHVKRRLTLTNQSGVTAGGQDAGQFIGAGTVQLFLNITALSGTTPSLTVYVDGCWDGSETTDGTHWVQLGGFPAQTATTPNPATAGVGAASPLQIALGRFISGSVAFPDRLRCRWTLSGTTPSTTFSVEGVVE